MKKIIVVLGLIASSVAAWFMGREFGFSEAAKILTHATSCKIKRSWYV